MNSAFLNRIFRFVLTLLVTLPHNSSWAVDSRRAKPNPNMGAGGTYPTPAPTTYRMGSNDDGSFPNGTRKAFTEEDEVSTSCPFPGLSTSANDLVGRVTSALRQLDGETKQCAAVSSAIEQSQQSLTALQTRLAEENFSSNPQNTNCANYESRLRRQFDLAVAEESNAAISISGNSPYNSCKNAPEGFRKCAENTYIAELDERVQECGYQSAAIRNQSARSNLENLMNVTLSMIDNASSCSSPQATQAVLNAAISQATAATAVANGLGLVGLGVSMGGRLLSSLVNKLFNKNSAQNFLRSLGNEQGRQSRYCLFHDVQNAALRCEAAVLSPAADVSVGESSLCEDERNGVNSLITFSRQMRQALTPAPAPFSSVSSSSGDRSTAATATPSPTSATNLSVASNYIDQLSRPVGSTGKSKIDLIRDAAATLSSSPSAIDKVYAAEMQKMVGLYDEIRQATQATGFSPNDEFLEKIEEFTSLAAQQPYKGQPAKLDMAEALTNYLALKTNINSPAGILTASSEVMAAVRESNNEVRLTREALQGYADANALDLSLSSLVSNMRSEFVDHLKELDRDYEAHKNNYSDATEHMRWLTHMLPICMASQSMSYLPNDNRSSLNNFQNRPNADYNRICAKFKCADKSLFVSYDDATAGVSGTPVEKFRKYQCASSRRTKGAVEKMFNNLKQTGKICGNE